MLEETEFKQYSHMLNFTIYISSSSLFLLQLRFQLSQTSDGVERDTRSIKGLVVCHMKVLKTADVSFSGI